MGRTYGKPNNIRTTIAPNKLREIRLARGMTLREVCRRCGIHLSHLSKMERYTTEQASLLISHRLAKFYGKTLEEIWPQLENS